jgi:hypothetical protein
MTFRPHDFRRMFATEAVAGGLPVHIAAKVLGHANLQTTQHYLAVFPDEIIRAYRAYLDNRRSIRPEAEYREPTQEEWNAFQQHFHERKLELGSCSRPYGTPCQHEHVSDVRCCAWIPDNAGGLLRSFVTSRTASKRPDSTAGSAKSKACRQAATPLQRSSSPSIAQSPKPPLTQPTLESQSSQPRDDYLGFGSPRRRRRDDRRRVATRRSSGRCRCSHRDRRVVTWPDCANTSLDTTAHCRGRWAAKIDNAAKSDDACGPQSDVAQQGKTTRAAISIDWFNPSIAHHCSFSSEPVSRLA